MNSCIVTREVIVAPGVYLAGRAALADSAVDLSAETKQSETAEEVLVGQMPLQLDG